MQSSSGSSPLSLKQSEPAFPRSLTRSDHFRAETGSTCRYTRDLPAAFRERATMLRDHAAEQGAASLDWAASCLEQALLEEGEAPLSIAAAADESGYSCAQIRRLLRSGALVNIGSPGEARVRRGDLPRKPMPRVAEVQAAGVLSRSQVAREIARGG